MKYLNQTCRIIVGCLFIFSGFIKLNDPVGTAIKLEEYFEVFAEFSPVFHAFIPFALYLSVFMCVLEVVLGVALLLYYRMELTLWLLLMLIVFFTFLTFYSAYFNKVTDCGCFGDFLKLTPWTSFTKDMLLLVLIGVLFIQRKNFEAILSNTVGDVVIVLVTIAATYTAYYTINHLSFFDFRPYKVGNNIPALMKAQPVDKYIYLMEKGGKVSEFEVYPTDPGYKYVSMKYEYTLDGEKIVSDQSPMPTITDFRVWNDEGDVTEETFKGSKMLITILNAEKADVESIKEINALVKLLEQNQVKVMVLTASDAPTFDHFRHEVQLAVPYYFSDGTVLKTIIRSNPGLILLKNGVVKGKWHYNDVPTIEKVKEALK
ncbi:MAG: hypothetical protein RL711_801 [Bacteroidota bacterium]